VRIDLVAGERARRRHNRQGRSGVFESVLAFPRARLNPPTPRVDNAERARGREELARRRREKARAQRAAAPRHKLRLAGAILRRIPMLLILLGLMAVVAYISVDAKFFVYQASVTGAKYVDAGRIYEAAGVHEQNILWIHPREVAQRIIELDGIRTVRVQCDLPAKIRIEVEERKPALVWRSLSQKKDWWLDREGIVLPYGGDPHAPETLYVIDSDARNMETGQRLQPDAIVPSVLQLSRALPDVKVFYYQADRGLSFIQQEGSRNWPVYVGGIENLARKIEVMRALNSHLSAKGIQPRYVDVRWSNRPVYGQQPSAAAAGGN
jgi:cell division septal protein FtsQ